MLLKFLGTTFLLVYSSASMAVDGAAVQGHQLTGEWTESAAFANNNDREIRRIKAQIRRLEQQVAQVRRSLVNINQRIDYRRGWIESKREQIQSERAHQRSLRQRLKAEQARERPNQTTINSLNAQISGSERKIEAYRNVLAGYRTQIQQARSERRQANSRIASIESEISALQSELDRLQRGKRIAVRFNGEQAIIKDLNDAYQTIDLIHAERDFSEATSLVFQNVSAFETAAHEIQINGQFVVIPELAVDEEYEVRLDSLNSGEGELQITFPAE